MRMIIVCSDPTLVSPLRRVLDDQDHQVEVTELGHAALSRIHANAFDSIIVGATLSDMTAADLVGMLRRLNVATPVVVYGWMDVEGKVQVLDAGADDCLVPPVNSQELAARLRALLRRGTADQGAWLRCSGIEMHLTSRTVRAEGRQLRLTPREFTLLEHLLRHRDRIVGRAVLKERVWGGDDGGNGSNVVDVYVSRLRRKLRAAGSTACIRTVPGSGYTLIGEEPAAETEPP
ncbi:MAG: response regulator transcription factor [Trueperaceae bacterium]|nr:response regulator transcription factor [Trueperaceae bacterium]